MVPSEASRPINDQAPFSSLIVSLAKISSITMLFGALCLLGAMFVSLGGALFLGFFAGALFTASIVGRTLRHDTEATTLHLAALKNELHKMGSSAQELAQRQKVLTDNIAAAVILRDAANRIIFCSPYTEVLTGYSRDELLRFPNDFLLDIGHPDDRERYERSLKIGAMGEAFQIRHRLFHKTGIEMWVETRTVPILDQDGEVVQSLSVMLDVTGAVRYQRQVEEKNRDLHDFAYMVSHDLKGPIMTIKGMLGVLADDLPAGISNDAHETLGHIRTATQRLEQLVASVLEYSKLSTLDEHSEPVDLSKVLGELLQHLAPQLSAIGGVVQVADKPPVVVGEHVWMYQVFSNLLGNAIKYRDQTRPLKVSIDFAPQGVGREVVISIKDNGLGIPADKIPLLFRPFQRAHGKHIDGTGIGLASVKRVLEKCGGSVRVESREGEGSTFYVVLRTARH